MEGISGLPKKCFRLNVVRRSLTSYKDDDTREEANGVFGNEAKFCSLVASYSSPSSSKESPSDDCLGLSTRHSRKLGANGNPSQY